MNLNQYCNPMATAPWQHEPFTVKLTCGWVTVAATESCAIIHSSKIPGVRTLATSPFTERRAAELFGPQCYEYVAPTDALREWAGAPAWPLVARANCKQCNGTGEISCPICGKAGFCSVCLGEPEPCLICNPCVPTVEGWLVGVRINRTILARAMESMSGDKIGLHADGPEQLLYLSDGDVRAVIAPLIGRGDMRLDIYQDFDAIAGSPAPIDRTTGKAAAEKYLARQHPMEVVNYLMSAGCCVAGCLVGLALTMVLR